MHRAQNFYRALRIGYRRLEQRRFVCSPLSFAIARPGVPRGRHHTLIVLNLLVLDVHPVPQRSPRRRVEAPALDLFRPGIRIPSLAVVDAEVTVSQLVAQFGHPLRDLASHYFGFDRSRCDSSPRPLRRTSGSHLSPLWMRRSPCPSLSPSSATHFVTWPAIILASIARAATRPSVENNAVAGAFSFASTASTTGFTSGCPDAYATNIRDSGPTSIG